MAIARVPLDRIGTALRQDGSPPLYYLLLHGWIRLVGTGDVAVRALSGIFAVAALGAAFLLARELRGSRFAGLVVLVTATNPWWVRYGSETRMYALEALEVTLGALALVRLLRGRSRAWAAFLAVDTAALLLTHYWAAFLLTPTFCWLVWRLRRHRGEPQAWWAVGALVAGALLFLPWLPTFLFQLHHTGTPWAGRPTIAAVIRTVGQWAGGPQPASLLAAAYWVLLALGAGGSGTLDARRHRLSLELRGTTLGRRLLAATFVPLLLACLASATLGGAYAVRYTAIVVPAFCLLVALGVDVLVTRRARLTALVVVTVLGLAVDGQIAVAQRTDAAAVAAALAPVAPGDVVAFCPDQLGPAVHRLTQAGRQYVYPSMGPADRVNWIDYEARNTAGDPNAVARALVQLAGRHRVWLVWSEGYRTFGHQCTELADALSLLRGATVQRYMHASGDSEVDVFAGRPRPPSAAFPPVPEDQQ